MWIRTEAGSKFTFCSRLSWCRSWTFQLRFKEIETSCQSRQAEDVFPKKYTDVWQKQSSSKVLTPKIWDQAWSPQWLNRGNQTTVLLLKCSLYSIFPQVALFFVNQINSSDELHTTWIVFSHSNVKINKKKNGSWLCLHYLWHCC